MQDVAILISHDNNSIMNKQRLSHIKDAGFKNVFMHWEPENYGEDNWKEAISYIGQIDLNIIFVHLSYSGINSIWGEGQNGDELVKKYKNNIKECKDNDIPMVIMHLTSKTEAPMYSELGLNRLREITEYANELGIKVAFENTRIKGYLDYVIKNITDDNVGICYDSGHCHLHFDDEFNYDNFKDRIIAVHLHDNDKSDDLHLLPFDGTIDWDSTLKALKYCNFKGEFTLESVYRYDYLKITEQEFYKKSYNIAKKLTEIYDKII